MTRTHGDAMSETLRVRHFGWMGELANAIAWAVEAHRDQIYRGYNGRADEPYILHPIRVMMAVPPEARTVAVLHDCLEDAADLGLPDWLSPVEYQALLNLTRTATDEYEAYIEQIATFPGKEGELARVVKIADLRDHLAHDPPERLRTRYEKALARLEDT